ncbi:NAD-dependent epimerase/dehydratase family protein, partial [Streptomyces sp. TverLS-915]|uniref:NAD-dependent epimerase/dehydratase family protein n=1 Tax=Streptomyces sp. TverLS-915 TaxID=1839763 RepID=UPI00351E07D9
MRSNGGGVQWRWEQWSSPGAAGNIGSVVRRVLRREVSRLVLLDRVPLQVEAANEVVQIVDLRDATAVEAALVGADAVLHLGGRGGRGPA